LVLQVDHTFIYHPAVEKLKDIMVRGELGDLYYFDSVACPHLSDHWEC
jgi:predicted dehydrogenase